MSEIKRLNYFRHQFLNEKDFQDEQAYHLEMRRRLNRSLYSEGVIEGLQVERRSEREVTITPGVAIDRQGREIVLSDPAYRDVGSLSPNQHGYLAVEYHEGFEQSDHHSSAGVEGYTRVTESPEVRIFPHHPPDDGTTVVLGRVHLDEAGFVREIDHTGRKHAGTRAAPGSIHTEALADGSVTPAKLAGGLKRQTGWLRLSFKPIPEMDRTAFAVGPTEAICGREGATGSMGIPSPPGATRITGFRLAGEVNDAGITIELYKCGWDPIARDHEKRTLLKETFGARKATGNRSPFEEMKPLEESLDPEHHALSVRVIGAGRTSVSLVAVRFEYELQEMSPGT